MYGTIFLFAGKTLSVLNTSVVMYNPDHHDAHRLRGWYAAMHVDFATEQAAGI
jgi:hypothetical protein